jgi:uncharacterized protein YjbI with pentapeptide repeats
MRACDFRDAQLTGSKFTKADLGQSNFGRATMSGCDFREAKLSGADFTAAVMIGAQFGDAAMFTADLRGANLQGARGLTSQQLSQSRTDGRTILPSGAPGPYLKGSGDERTVLR